MLNTSIAGICEEIWSTFLYVYLRTQPRQGCVSPAYCLLHNKNNGRSSQICLLQFAGLLRVRAVPLVIL